MAGLDKWLYNFAKRRKIPWFGLTGETLLSVSCLLKDSSNKILLCSGTTVPTAGTSGFAKGCLFLKTDAATTIGGRYMNIGTSTSCIFVQATIAMFLPANATVNAKTTTGSLTTSDLGKNITNTGAAGTIQLTLPAVASCAGLCARVYVTVAQIIQILPATGEAIALGGSAVVTKYLNIAAVIGNYCDFFCDGSVWHVTGYSGVVTKEA